MSDIKGPSSGWTLLDVPTPRRKDYRPAWTTHQVDPFTEYATMPFSFGHRGHGRNEASTPAAVTQTSPRRAKQLFQSIVSLVGSMIIAFALADVSSGDTTRTLVLASALLAIAAVLFMKRPRRSDT